MNNIIAIIPARGGSKGIKNKNIKLFNKKPLISYTINACLNSKIIDMIYVSTDSKKIADVSSKYGADIIKRPPFLAEDHSSSEDALLHAIQVIENQGILFEIMVFLQCTSPLLKSDVINKCVKKVRDEGYDSALSVYETYRYFGEDIDGDYHPFRKKRERRQEMKPWLCDNGAIYVIKKELFKKYKNRYFGKIGYVIMEESDSYEIDEPMDFWLLQKIMKYKENKNKLKK